MKCGNFNAIVFGYNQRFKPKKDLGWRYQNNMTDNILTRDFTNPEAYTNDILPLGDSVLASWIRSICQTARGYDVCPEDIMKRAYLNENLLSVPEARYPAMYVRRFWELMLNAVGDNLFGLRCGAEMQVSALHGLGLAIITSHSLAQVLDLITIYCKVISSTMDISLSHDHDGTMLKIRTLHGSEVQNSASLALVALIARQANSLAQHPVKPVAVHLSYDGWVPHERRRLETYFGCPVIIDPTTDNGIMYSYGDVIEPYASSNALLREANERVIKNYLYKVHRNSYTARVEEEICKFLDAGESIKITSIARGINISSRTLQRRLEAEGTTFVDVVERYRKQMAHDALAHTEQSITEIAYSVGFSDLSNFSRKCYRWFGVSPAVYRKRIRQLQH